MDTINTLTAIMAGIFGAGWGLQFLYYRYEKRKRKAEARVSELNVDAKEDEMRDAKLLRAYEQIEKLQTIVDREREKWVKLSIELSEVKEELMREVEARKLAESRLEQLKNNTQ